MLTAPRPLRRQNSGSSSDSSIDSAKSNQSTDYVKVFASLLQKKIKPLIDPVTKQCCKEHFFVKEFHQFSELNRVLSNEKLTDDEKLKLIALPERTNIRKFIRAYLDVSGGHKDLLPYAFELLRRFLSNTCWKLQPTNWKILVILSLKVAQKKMGSYYVSAQSLNLLYPIYSEKDYAELEAQFLGILDFNLHIHKSEYAAVHSFFTCYTQS
mmetsp:Transcript_43062/g.49485  ORF Transcript_43062/g.49485 Transcript_43062/m.49485 type:complete len:211 (-) Transcript_43062:622-1254(-)